MILLLTCTYNRHTALERLVRFYLDQDYPSDSMLFIYNNSPVPQTLDKIECPVHKKISLVNNHLDLETGKEYNNVGAIHRDALHTASKEKLPYMVTFFEDDNYYLPDHISKGVGGMKRAYEQKMRAYKPKYSYFKNGDHISLAQNIMEPSIFVNYDFLLQHGFYPTSVNFHHKWIEQLKRQGEYFIDPTGKPTLIYIVHDNNLSYTMNNGIGGMIRCRKKAKDIGDQLITPCSKEEAIRLYNLIQKD